MDVIETEMPSIRIVEPKIFGDSRPSSITRAATSKAALQRLSCRSISRARSVRLRGLHIQNPKREGKLVTVLRGAVLEVAVDVRVGSPTFGRHVKVELSDENRWQFWLPRGFAHGFLVAVGERRFFL